MANKNRRRYKKGKTFKKILREKLGVMIIIILLVLTVFLLVVYA